MKTDFLSYGEATLKLSISEKVGQLFMPAAFINDTEEEIQALEEQIIAQGIGGICFFHSRASAATNFEGKKEVVHNERSFETLKGLIARYQKAAKYPLIIAIDAEWGLAMRIENTPQYPYSITLGAMENGEDLIFEVGKNIAQDCLKAGIHWNFTPVVDINNNPKNPVIGYRSFGEDKNFVTKKATALKEGMKSIGILSSIKHFPGHGDTATDSHLDLPLIDKSKKELLEHELYPFQKIIDQGVDSVMVGHLNVPALTGSTKIPTSISPNAIKGVLRGEMGFEGVVVSDALNMHAVSKKFTVKGDLEWEAFNAGNDVLCFTEHISEGIKTINLNATKDQIEKSFKRVWTLKEKAFNVQVLAPNPSAALKSDDTLNQKIAEKCLTLYKGDEQVLAQFSTKNFIGLSISEKYDNQFFKSILLHKKFNHLWTRESDSGKLKDNLDERKDILIALFPPKVKPQNNFDIEDDELELIQYLLNHKNVVLYLFGNPYVLNLFDLNKAMAVVIAYQNFPVFQEHAAKHYLGEVKANGKLPVTINPEMT